MDITEKNGEIILRDYPLKNWIEGILFLLGFILFILPVVNAAGLFATQTPDIYLIIPFVFAMFALYWAGQKLLSPLIITRIKPAEQTVHISRIKFPFITKPEIYHFSQIKFFETVKRKPDRAYLYFNVMILDDDSCIDLESSGMEIQTNRIPAKLNELLKKHRKPRQKR